jgi:uncharacterized repeat protein (TIGR03803 family)
MASRLFRLLIPAVLALMANSTASATGYSVLYSFCQTDCPDGNLPVGRLLRDASGTLYGVSYYGGANSGGMVFSLTPKNGAWQFQTLYAFCAVLDCTDGHNPDAGLIADSQGNLYGTTENGGSLSGGDVFELIPNKHRTRWKLKVLYDFCPQSSCLDGRSPNTPLTYQGAASGALYDGVSALYGATFIGGAYGDGAIFSLTPKGGARKWAEKILYSFCPNQGCADGELPSGGIALDGAGNLFADTQSGGDANMGTVVELSPAGHDWNETRLYSFCAAKDCKDGSAPSGSLLLDASGDVIGTVQTGGANNGGAIFKLSPSGSAYAQSLLYSFCQQQKCADGQKPRTGVAMDSAGDLIGTAAGGGTKYTGGTVFNLKGSLDVLYSFCTSFTCPDGKAPGDAPVEDGQGDLFGMTTGGGAYGDGAIYEVTP